MTSEPALPPPASRKRRLVNPDEAGNGMDERAGKRASRWGAGVKEDPVGVDRGGASALASRPMQTPSEGRERRWRGTVPLQPINGFEKMKQARPSDQADGVRSGGPVGESVSLMSESLHSATQRRQPRRSISLRPASAVPSSRRATRAVDDCGGACVLCFPWRPPASI
jgi:hypothetical protein